MKGWPLALVLVNFRDAGLTVVAECFASSGTSVPTQDGQVEDGNPNPKQRPPQGQPFQASQALCTSPYPP